MAYVIREIELALETGVGRPQLTAWRKAGRLVEGRDWGREGKPAAVWYTSEGVQNVREILKAPAGGAGVDTSEAANGPESNASAGGVHRYADADIPRLPQNGLLVEHGRPGWWTQEEAMVLGNRFANRKAVLVDFGGRQVICRVKDSRNFQPQMVIPVRRYGGILVAARQPRFPGKW